VAASESLANLTPDWLKLPAIVSLGVASALEYTPDSSQKSHSYGSIEQTSRGGNPWHDATGQKQLLLKCLPVAPGTRGPVGDHSLRPLASFTRQL